MYGEDHAPGGRMTDSGDTTANQGRRIEQHELLGPLTDTEIITMTVDGQPLQARKGEPIAAALMANGINICRAMPESGESRGVFCGVGRCSDCLMIVDGVLNVRTCVTPVVDGTRVETQHGLGQWEDGQP
jgi:aerobic-type carbon monoxide dehydrogenase small subunit (CoxS/CutS family)